MFKKKYTFLIFQYRKYALQAVDITQETDTLSDRLKYTLYLFCDNYWSRLTEKFTKVEQFNLHVYDKLAYVHYQDRQTDRLTDR